MSNKESSLSQRRAFVMHLGFDIDIRTGRLPGRIEHVATGQTAHFESADELWAFVSRILSEVAKETADEIGRRGTSASKVRSIISRNECLEKGADDVR
jgi:hypothetical protein